MCIKCNVQDPNYAAYLEMHTGQSNLMSFVTLNEDDRDLLIKQEHLRVSVFCINEDQKLPPCPFNVDSLRKYGVMGTLLETLEAPHPVKLALCHFCGVHRVLIGGESDRVMASLKSLPATNVYTPGTVYSIIQSKYGARAMTTSSIPVRPSRILVSTGGGQRAELDRLIAECEEKIGHYETERQEAEQSLRETKPVIDALNAAHARFEKEKRRCANAHADIKRFQQLIEGLAKDSREDSEKALREKIARAIMDKATHIAELCNSVAEATAIKTKLITPAFQQSVVLRRQAAVHREKVAARSEVDQAEAAAAEERKRYDSALAHTRELRAVAEQTAKLTDAMKAEINSRRESIDDVETRIARIKSQIEADTNTNPHVIREYEERAKKIDEEGVALRKIEDSLAKTRRRMAAGKNKWLPPLKEVVARIDEVFARLMGDIQCEGHVKLAENEMFNKFAIEIYVRFREKATLQRLTEHVQSGGEKSVSTMLYIISLQDITQCPFRLVDEINQGMDPRNERMIFRQIAKSSCRPGLPQCFLVTPKLLSGLEYTKEMTVHCVYNGPYNAPYKP